MNNLKHPEDLKSTIYTQATDLLFRSDNSVHACYLIEKIVAYLQFCAHPLFNITDSRHRLEYKVSENRPFHIVILKYLYLLTNKACHRTALELAKMLLNLDPSDPLAVVLIIDTLAIRAREYQWLIEMIDYLDKDRDAGYMFNMKYSKALAHYRVARKQKEDLGCSDDLLQQAIISFPWVVKEILKNAKVTSFKLGDEHELFSAYGNSPNCKNLRSLTPLYAGLIGSWWSDAEVVQWVIRNAQTLAQKYDNDQAVKAEVKRQEDILCSVFTSLPSEFIRHLHVIKYMSDLVADGLVPQVPSMPSFDPRPPVDTINRYKYSARLVVAFDQLQFNEALRRMFARNRLLAITDGAGTNDTQEGINYNENEEGDEVVFEEDDEEEDDLGAALRRLFSSPINEIKENGNEQECYSDFEYSDEDDNEYYLGDL